MISHGLHEASVWLAGEVGRLRRTDPDQRRCLLIVPWQDSLPLLGAVPLWPRAEDGFPRCDRCGDHRSAGLRMGAVDTGDLVVLFRLCEDCWGLELPSAMAASGRSR